MTIVAYGWFLTVDEADTYFKDERLETSAWDALSVSSAKNEKAAVLNMAYNRIYYSQEFIVPTYDEASAADLIVLKKAQAEMAYYLAMHLADEDRRKGLHAQGVSKSDAVKETYGTTSDITSLDKTPIPQFVRDLLVGYWALSVSGAFVRDIARDENKSVSETVTDEEDWGN